jgi:hypothetical protein
MALSMCILQSSILFIFMESLAIIPSFMALSFIDVAKVGFDAMMDGEGDVVAGWKNKFQAAMANVTPASVLAAQHAKMAAPGTAKN